MSALLDASQKIATCENPAALLRRADRYITFWEKDPDNFVLPAKHADLAPVLAAFVGGKHERFRAYVRAMRDEVRAIWGASSTQYDGMQQFVRTLDVRAAQRMRRDKLSRAAEWMRQTRPDIDADARSVWLRRLEQTWAQERLDALRQRAVSAHQNRLSVEEKREVLDEFWASIDARIESGDLPTYEDLI